MKKIQAQPLTDQSWILTEWGNRVGLLSQSAGNYRLITRENVEAFISLEDLSKTKNWAIEFVKTEEAEEAGDQMISHLPIKHKQAFDTEMEPTISYTKQEGSSVRFAAGYWGLRFSHAWTAAFCPKMATLSEYDHVGPFSTKLELNTVLAQKNKELNRKEVQLGGTSP